MAMICPNCGSADTQAAVDKNSCLNCGKLFWPDGTQAAPGPDETARRRAARALEPRTDHIVGNLADLQIAGAPNTPDSVGKVAAENPPAGIDYDEVAATQATAEKVRDKVDAAVGEVDKLTAPKATAKK